MSPVAVQPVEAAAGEAEQSPREPDDWASVSAVGEKDVLQPSATEVAVTEPAVTVGAVKVAAWALA